MPDQQQASVQTIPESVTPTPGQTVVEAQNPQGLQNPQGSQNIPPVAKKSNFLKIAIIFVLVILVIAGGFFLAKKFNLLKKFSNAIVPPKVGDGGLQKLNSQEEETLNFAGGILKTGAGPFTATGFFENKIDQLGASQWSSQQASGSATTSFNYLQSQSGEVWERAVKVEVTGLEKPTFEEVLSVFDKYFDVPSKDKKDWTYTFPYQGNNGIETYEIVSDNPDGSYDTRSAMVVVYKDKPDIITVLACRVFKGDPAYANHTCFH